MKAELILNNDFYFIAPVKPHFSRNSFYNFFQSLSLKNTFLEGQAYKYMTGSWHKYVEKSTMVTKKNV
jgi:hypothetical protein